MPTDANLSFSARMLLFRLADGVLKSNSAEAILSLLMARWS
jgi:hypothetical protein